ncbi:hypothetical protein AZE42_04867 [Rhizopogon vesiculosus]|uniref:Arrestin-like N-terminal domain-containing protein n=1 Tax=Rhizopogon vesiculosus TaxID=180088 RepID=A0A1J8QWK5_9AGAM|nr:hypothetical protein AZE42_04867 [Rhizopogon vesiculosus]
MESIPPSYSPSASPSYTPSPPSPSYSTALLPGEQTVEETRWTGSQTHNIGVFRRITDNITLVLRDQQPGSIKPSYGRNALIRGHISLRSSEGLTDVTLMLEGQIRTETSGTTLTTTIVSTSYSLWNSSSTEPCPKTLPFMTFFPSTFVESGQSRPLPPSFENKSERATCSYTLSVIVSRPRRFLSSFRSSDALVVPIRYHPRSRAHTPMLPSDAPFLTTVKTSPEEWRQVLCTMNTTQRSGLAPVQCLLFIPSVQIYALSETIPFHLQLRGPPSSLAPFLDKTSGEISIRVYLLRQVIVKAFDDPKTASRRILGEAKLTYCSPLPENHYSYRNHPLREGNDCLDWDGELRCAEDDTVASFATQTLTVRDYIVLSLDPLEPMKCPLLATKCSHPIRLVTDSWSDRVMTW